MVINGVITHRKLPQMQGYHIFPSTRDVYLPKNHYENHCNQKVQMTPNLGPLLTEYCHNYIVTMLSLPVIKNNSRYANFYNFTELYIV